MSWLLPIMPVLGLIAMAMSLSHLLPIAISIALATAPLYRIGKPGFFTYGRVVYHDIYSGWWVTKFCYRYEGDGSFVPHGDYNNEEGPFDKRPA